jgi:hypothetical protein
MDSHTGPTHDMPDYVPNWPVPVKIKAQVYQRNGFWFWAHVCPNKGHRVAALGHPKLTHKAAFAAALKHARGCW